MKRQSLLVVISTVLMITAYTTINGQANGSDSWSAYIGQMKWKEANDKCISIGMRLPTLNELKAEFDNGKARSWLINGKYFWSSTPGGDGEHYSIDVLSGKSNPDGPLFWGHVRCHW